MTYSLDPFCSIILTGLALFCWSLEYGSNRYKGLNIIKTLSYHEIFWSPMRIDQSLTHWIEKSNFQFSNIILNHMFMFI